MTSDPKPPNKRSRGLVLTEDALKIVDQELRKRWEESETRKASKTGKLLRGDKEVLLDLDRKTIDKIYRYQPVDEITLRHVFSKLNITSSFSIEKYCVSATLPASNLKHIPTPCIGRETEVAEIKALLASNRLVTLIGTGGVGKTRLALQVSEEMQGHFTAGVWLVELAGVTDPALVSQQIASTLGILERESPLLQTLSDFLRGKPLLLILDNCEHLLDACATLTDHLLSFPSSTLKIQATSRERLNIPFEHPFYVPSLGVPDMQALSDGGENSARLLQDSASVRLFVERARVLRPDFAVTDQNAPAVAAICHRLDGIPLAIELAAARMRSMTLSKLRSGLDNCFQFLKGGSRVLPRHQTLQATMDWSYDLLREEEKLLLHRLSVFSGGWQQEAAEKICAVNGTEEQEMLDSLTSLVDKSLIVYEEREEQDRYRLLETVRQYAAGKLEESGEANVIRDRHRDYFLTLAETTEPHLWKGEQVALLQRLEEEHTNLSAALEWSLAEANSNAGIRFCRALIPFWSTRDYLTEGREWCRRALLTVGHQERTADRVMVLAGAGGIAERQCDYAAAQAYYEESLNISEEIGDKRMIASALNGLGNVVFAQDYEAARTLYAESLAVWREIGDQSSIASTLSNLGLVANVQGDYSTARTLYEESLTFFRAFGPPSCLATLLSNLGLIENNLGNYEAAHPLYEESLTLWHEVGNQRASADPLINLAEITLKQKDYTTARNLYSKSLMICRKTNYQSGIAISLNGLAEAVLSGGDYIEARKLYAESMVVFQKIGDKRGIAYSLEAFASLAVHNDNAERAAMLWGAGAALRTTIHSPLTPTEQETYDSAVAEARQTLGEEAFLAAWDQGGPLPLEQAISYALEKPEL